jgi:hypothetical protein
MTPPMTTNTMNTDPEPAAAIAAGPSARPDIAARISGACTALRFVSERPPSLLDHVAYAQRGEWTEELDGPRRLAAHAYAWAVAIPVATVAYLLVWASARFVRCLTLVAVVVLVATALAQVPVLGWLIPTWLQL